MDVTEKSDEQLAAEAAREGSDGPAFVALMTRHRERVWRLCFRLMDHAEDAQDAAQEVFVRMFLHRAKFSGRSKYSTWLHGMAVRTCLHLRRGRGRRQHYESAAAAQFEQRTAHRYQQQTTQPAEQLDLTRMLATLDEEDRALLLLKYVEDYTFDELGTMFDLTTSAVKMRVSRAREKLQARFPDQSF